MRWSAKTSPPRPDPGGSPRLAERSLVPAISPRAAEAIAAASITARGVSIIASTGFCTSQPASATSSTTMSASSVRAFSIARGLEAGRKSNERQRRRSAWSMAFRFLLEESPFVYMISPSAGRESRHGPVFYDFDRPGHPLPVFGYQGRPPRLSIYDRIFRPLHHRRAPRPELLPALLLSRRPQGEHDGAGPRHSGPGDHHQRQCDGRSRRHRLLPGPRRGQGGL